MISAKFLPENGNLSFQKLIFGLDLKLFCDELRQFLFIYELNISKWKPNKFRDIDNQFYNTTNAIDLIKETRKTCYSFESNLPNKSFFRRDTHAYHLAKTICL